MPYTILQKDADWRPWLQQTQNSLTDDIWALIDPSREDEPLPEPTRPALLARVQGVADVAGFKMSDVEYQAAAIQLALYRSEMDTYRRQQDGLRTARILLLETVALTQHRLFTPDRPVREWIRDLQSRHAVALG
jgi:hypothetical protein